MNPTLVVGLSLLVVTLVVTAGLLAAAETAFTRLSRSRADALAAAEAEDHPDGDELDERVEELRELSRRPLSTLATLALTLLAVQLGAVVCGWFAGREIGGDTGAIVGAGATVAALFVAISISRSRSLLAPDTSAVGLVPIIRAVSPLSFLTAGVVRLARRSSNSVEPDPDVDEQQLLAIVGETAAIDRDEEALIKRVVAFDDTVVGAIMTPRTDMVTLRSGFAVSDALEVASLHGLSRIPVTAIDGDVDEIIGAVHVKDLVVASLDGRNGHDIDLWLRVAPVVPEGQRIANLLNDLKTGEMHLAIVIDEHGGVAGVVTLEDILEELVGEIEDEFDQPEPGIELVDTTTVRVDGRFELLRLHESTGIELHGEYRTVAGCIFNRLGRVPEVGDVVTLDACELEVRRMHGRRIADVEIRTVVPLASPLASRDLEEATP